MFNNSNVLLKFYKPNGESFSIGSNLDWRFTKKKGLSGFGSINGTVSFTDNVNADGGDVNRIRFSKIDRTVKCTYLYWRNNPQARRQFLSFFTPRVVYRVYLTYMGVTRWAPAQLYKLQASEDTEEENMMVFQMTFVFPSPYWNSVDDFGKNIAAVTGAGFPYLSRIGVGQPTGVFNFNRQVTLENDGDVDSNPKIYITANDDVVNPIVRIGDGWIKVIDEMQDKDEIEIDTTAIPPTVKKNGVNCLGKCDRRSNFLDMVIKRGDNTVSFDADNGSNHMSVVIYYNKLYAVI